MNAVGMMAFGFAAYTHGVMSSTYARQIAHRYMPEVLTNSSRYDPIIVDPNAFNRYIRARIEFEAPHSFGVISQLRDEHMTVFVLNRHDEFDVVKAVLWGTSDVGKRQHELRTLAVWHGGRFDRSLTADLGACDSELWKQTFE